MAAIVQWMLRHAHQIISFVAWPGLPILSDQWSCSIAAARKQETYAYNYNIAAVLAGALWVHGIQYD